MERVCVIGCSGSGKSTLARRIAPTLGLPLVHLDREFWLPGWTKPGSDAWRAKVAAFVAEPRWIIDGNYAGSLAPRLERADTVVFLDFPTRICLTRIVYRVVTGIGRTRPDAAPGCPERLDLDFLRFVWRFRKVHRPKVLERLRAFRGDLITLTSPAEVEAFARGLEDRFSRATASG